MKMIFPSVLLILPVSILLGDTQSIHRLFSGPQCVLHQIADVFHNRVLPSFLLSRIHLFIHLILENIQPTRRHGFIPPYFLDHMPSRMICSCLPHQSEQQNPPAAAPPRAGAPSESGRGPRTYAFRYAAELQTRHVSRFFRSDSVTGIHPFYTLILSRMGTECNCEILSAHTPSIYVIASQSAHTGVAMTIFSASAALIILSAAI